MGRPRKQSREPFWFADRNAWYVHHGNKKVRLSPDRDEAWQLWHELMAKPPEERKPPAASGDPFVVQVIDDFLEWSKVNRSAGTYDIYYRLLQKFADGIPCDGRSESVAPGQLRRRYTF